MGRAKLFKRLRKQADQIAVSNNIAPGWRSVGVRQYEKKGGWELRNCSRAIYRALKSEMRDAIN